METVAFYSYKGGVGRTLLVAYTAEFLAMSGRRVVALDLDLEAPGLHYKLANPEVLKRAKAGTLRGAVDELLDLLEMEGGHPSLRETAIPVDLPTNATGFLHLIPAGAAPSPAYWASLERLNSTLRAPSRHEGLLEAVLELQARIADELDPEFLVIDSRAGITELGGLATSMLADRVVCLTTMAPESIQGIRVVAEALRAAPRLASQQPVRIQFLVSRVADGRLPADKVEDLKSLLGSEDVTLLLHDPGLAAEEYVLGRQRCRLPADADQGCTEEDFFTAILKWFATAFPRP